jgi:hypothetical protein
VTTATRYYVRSKVLGQSLLVPRRERYRCWTRGQFVCLQNPLEPSKEASLCKAGAGACARVSRHKERTDTCGMERVKQEEHPRNKLSGRSCISCCEWAARYLRAPAPLQPARRPASTGIAMQWGGRLVMMGPKEPTLLLAYHPEKTLAGLLPQPEGAWLGGPPPPPHPPPPPPRASQPDARAACLPATRPLSPHPTAGHGIPRRLGISPIPYPAWNPPRMCEALHRTRFAMLPRRPREAPGAQVTRAL